MKVLAGFAWVTCAVIAICFAAVDTRYALAQDRSPSDDERKELLDKARELVRRFDEAYRKKDLHPALALSEELLNVGRRLVGEEHQSTAMFYFQCGAVSEELGDYKRARSYYERSLAIRRKVVGENHAATASSFSQLGIVSSKLGDLAAARNYHESALSIYRKINGEDHASTAMCYNNLGIVSEGTGDYIAARTFYERALSIESKLLGADHAATGMAYGNLGNVSQRLGDFESARTYYERAVEIHRKAFGEDSAVVATSYHNLGIVFRHLGGLSKSVDYYKRELLIRRNTEGMGHPNTAMCLDSMGLVLNDLGDYTKAKECLQLALRIRVKSLGEEHPETALSWHHFSIILDDSGDCALARPLCSHALEIQEKALGKDHPGSVELHNSLIIIDSELGDWDRASDRAEMVRRSVRHQLVKLLPNLNDKEQRRYLEETNERNLEVSLSLAFLRPQVELIRDQSAGWLLNGKGVGQQALAERALLTREAHDPKRAPVVQQLVDVRRRLAQLSLSAPQLGQTEGRQKQLAELSRQESDLSRQLVEAGGARQVGEPWIELNRVRSALPPGSVLVDIARFRVFPLGEKDRQKKKLQPARYVAWVIPPTGKGDVQLVDLGEADPVDAQIKSLRERLQAVQGQDSTLLKEGEPKAEAELRTLFEKLAKQIWKPLAPHVAHANQLFLSPDGALWLVPWGAIPIEKDKFLIEKLSINYLISGRDVLGSSSSLGTISDIHKPVIFADPNFDLAPEEVTTAAKAVLRSTYHEEQGETQRSSDRSLLPKMGRLPGTAVEAQAVKPNLEKLAGEAPVVYQDLYALESVAKALHRPRVAVFSTHGFFLPDQEAKHDARDDRLAMAGNDTRAMVLTKEGKPFENPLLRCGLLFAGCNPRNEGQAGSGDDGVLTGMEIVGIDFRGTELVVLSACETGVGTVNNGEGVAGLRQAFQLAGAQAVVATLWQIPDTDSARLMNDFFANLAAGQSKGEALRNAQLKLIESRRERFGGAHPFFWAAFTLTGRYTKPTSKNHEPNSEGTANFEGSRAGQLREANGLKLVWIPAGNFTMGSPTYEKHRRNNEDRVHVTLTKGFWLGKYEVTQSQWRRLMQTAPWSDKYGVKDGDTYPASYVIWRDATVFCKKLTESEHQAGRLPPDWRYALPTEAQWEYACRAGTTTSFSFGDDESDLVEYGWFDHNTSGAGEEYPHMVGRKKANAWGLYDMHGNVREWCRDSYAKQLPGGTDPLVSFEGSDRVQRGGGWNYYAWDCRSAYRDGNEPTNRFLLHGLRVACLPFQRTATFAGSRTGQMRDDNGVIMKLLWIPPGKVDMGSPTDEREHSSDEGPVDVRLTKGFWLGQTEVTQAQWRAVMQTTPWRGNLSRGKGIVEMADDYPATYVSWDDAMQFCAKLTEMEHQAGRLPTVWKYTLPTEAQWEYACRAGTTTRFSFGNDDSVLSDYAWWGGIIGNGNAKSEQYAHTVGQKKANPWGLYDMHGNVWEWCRDWYRRELPGGEDPEVLDWGSGRAARGGGWDYSAKRCRSSTRAGGNPGYRRDDLGFRIACEESIE
jgi:formylglycine-generating enzyme required for sulfatase activity/tetratricopeptide (TPR) repeat protein